jgi:4-amino-4-deoxy-L-arabinose transferase-like glycosyltransferase
MPLPLTIACVWALLACLAAMAPQRYHWPAAWALIATGIPILGYVTLVLGPVWGLIVMAAGASVLRWPLIRAAERMRASLQQPPRE